MSSNHKSQEMIKSAVKIVLNGVIFNNFLVNDDYT